MGGGIITKGEKLKQKNAEHKKSVED